MLNTDEIVSWVDERIQSILDRPKMWGLEQESIEMQLLQLAEFRKIVVDGEKLLKEPRLIVNKWIQFSANRPTFNQKLSDDEFMNRMKYLVESLKNA